MRQDAASASLTVDIDCANNLKACPQLAAMASDSTCTTVAEEAPPLSSESGESPSNDQDTAEQSTDEREFLSNEVMDFNEWWGSSS